MKLTDKEIEQADAQHIEGKAVIGLIAMVLVGLLIGFFWIADKPKAAPINYIDDVSTDEVSNIS